jgi:hypothetical protein
MKKIILISLIYLATNTSIFAVSNISDMVGYKFSSSVGNTAQTTDKPTIKSSDDKFKSLDNTDVNTAEDVASESSADSTGDEFSEGAMIYDVTSVGIKNNAKYKDCLQIKIFGQGTWQTYCQPVKKPENCSDDNWNNLKSLAILSC